MSPWLVTAAAALYLGFLFAVAWRVDRGERAPGLERRWGSIYALSLAVYCTSWTFYGGVGTAAVSGWMFLPIYLGPALLYFFGWPFLRRLSEIGRAENTTSIADFISSRYGKSRWVATLVTAISALGALPYIALQLKAVGMSAAELTLWRPGAPVAQGEAQDQQVLFIALALAAFSVLFGARSYDATGRNRGLVVAIAVESAVKLAAFVAVGLFAWMAFNGLDPAAKSAGLARMEAAFAQGGSPLQFFTITLLSVIATFCLARQFYVAVVECRDPAHVRAARAPFIVYLALTALIAAPITMAGLAMAPAGANPDLFVLTVPLQAGNDAIALIAFMGGFAAATGMVVAVAVSLSTMVSNDLIAPILLRNGALARGADMGRLLLFVRRAVIVAIILAAYVYYLVIDKAGALAAIGLVAFAAMAQFAPALIGGVYWSGAHRQGAQAGLLAGGVIWAYTLFLPSYLGASGLAAAGFTGALSGLLNPQALFGFGFGDPLTHGVFWSLTVNTALYVLVSRAAQTTPAPVRARQIGGVRVGPAACLGDLRALAERFVGKRIADDEFAQFAFERGRSFTIADPVDPAAARLSERLIASVIGAPSARMIVASALSGAALDVGEVVHLLGETNQELQFSRELLATTMNAISQAVSVVDKDLRLVAWNKTYLEMFEFPPGFIHIGRPIADVIRFNAERGECGPGEVDAHVERRLAKMRCAMPHAYERRRPNGMVLKTMGNPMPGGGYVTTFTDISAEKAAQEALERANERLEDRVGERTAELSREVDTNRMLARELHSAKRTAEEASRSKTRFLAAAGHDLLQPLHAARLFAQAIAETDNPAAQRYAAKIDRSISAADELLRKLLDVAKLDAGAVKPNFTAFPIADLVTDLTDAFQGQADAKQLKVLAHVCGCWVYADRFLLRSVLQNFISNAVRYTKTGGVLVGCRRRGKMLRVEVWDTGPGVPTEKRSLIFQEFQRLDVAGAEKGLGLGLSIAERAARLMGAKLNLRSRVGKGSVFCIELLAVEHASHSHDAPHHAPSPAAAIAGARVACVDNESAILEGLEALLRGWGAEPVMAQDANTARALTGPFDLALVDFHLDDEETGLDILANWRARDLVKPGRAAIITADPSAELIEAARGLGAIVLRKPVDPADIAALIGQPVMAQLEMAK